MEWLREERALWRVRWEMSRAQRADLWLDAKIGGIGFWLGAGLSESYTGGFALGFAAMWAVRFALSHERR